MKVVSGTEVSWPSPGHYEKVDVSFAICWSEERTGQGTRVAGLPASALKSPASLPASDYADGTLLNRQASSWRKRNTSN